VCKEEREKMNLESMRSNKVRVAVGVVILLAVVSGAYLLLSTPTEISNAQELQQVRDNPSGNYVLVSDINLSGIDNFEPIENFTGTFDGNGHTISNLTIERPEADKVGLFGNVADETRLLGLVGDKGTVKDVRLEGVNVTGGNDVGGLTGINRGTVIDSNVKGNVSGKERVGGLAGFNRGEVLGSRAEVAVTGDRFVGGFVGDNGIYSTVSMSYATGNVSASDEVVSEGGLAGINGGEVRGSYATGDVANGGGGLVGWNTGVVRDSYATGDVAVGGGGLVGVNSGEIHSSYATGHVTGQKGVGGLAGTDDGITDVTDSYWDVNSTGQKSSAVGTPLTTSEMTGSSARENIRGFDFDETWETVTDPDRHPRLAWQNDSKGGSSSED